MVVAEAKGKADGARRRQINEGGGGRPPNQVRVWGFGAIVVRELRRASQVVGGSGWPVGCRPRSGAAGAPPRP
jgi:hypothetical protein